ncbi:MAG: bifunctional 4-hydroxy-3-methylbut-2-enyl diphosphate reductase/30S ribosomal protein S1 [Firmicutes bacterium]|nr:bifunctional 4-hydroxy-3-methylbut-2-enyl diphosphate reductase/30S ribosomal protein S1 [Bacillota bacterium]
MKVIISEYAGFCPGVKRALKKAEDVAAVGPVLTHGPLVHNTDMLAHLEAKGIKAAEDFQQGTDTVVLRSHGVGPEVADDLAAKGYNVIDGTCPYVTRIHNLVRDISRQGKHIVIIGKDDHPEVEGIKGWSESSLTVVDSIEDAEGASIPIPAAAVIQTTYNLDKLKDILKILRSRYPDLDIIDTICPTTKDRQREVAQLAAKVDLMLVIGGANSSNTRELVNICSQSGVPTHHIQNKSQLELNWFNNIQTVGIAAGASTPEWIIREVVDVVNEINNDGVETKEETSEILEQETKPIAVGDIVVGEVVQVNPDEILVDVGYKLEGLIRKDELSFRRVDDCSELVAVGDSIEAEVTKLSDDLLEMSARKVAQSKAWTKVKEAFENQTPLTAPVVEVVKGGLIVDLGLRGFMPASLVDLRFVEDLNQFVGQEVTILVIELERRRNKVIVSRKAYLLKELEEKKSETLANLEEGSVVKGIVRRLTNFGAFVDIGGIDGLIHISELAHNRVEHPSEVLSENQEVDVYVLKVDPEEERVSLSLKETLPDPWTQIGKEFKAGDVVEGKVVRLADFGAFVELIPGVDGLVHVSQISEEHVEKPGDVLSVGEDVKVKILDIDTQAKRVSLSIREATRTPRKPAKEEKSQEQGSIGVTIGERLGNLFDQSDE